MKIICVGMNYAAHSRELEQLSLQNTPSGKDPVIFLKPDSSILNRGLPFFLPDFSEDVQYETELVVRISRLGKAVSERFASRYYDAVTVGVDFTARDLQNQARQAGLPWDLSKGFDCSAVTGRFVPVMELGKDISDLNFHMDLDGRTVQRGYTGDMLHSVDRIVSYVSQFMTIKMGDLIFTGTPSGVGKVAVGNHLQGYLEGEKLLDFYVR